MALYYVDENQLSEIASAMETKEGKSLNISYPKGFINTIKNLHQEEYGSDMARWYFENRDTITSVPSSYTQEIESIYRRQFQDCKTLETAVFPECSIIGAYGFAGCSSLISADFPTCKIISSFAFSGCRNLQEIRIPECLQMSDSAFHHCDNLQQIDISKAAMIPSHAFAYCSMLSLVNASFCTHIYNSAFYNCVKLDNCQFTNCRIIGNFAFGQCSGLTDISLPYCNSIGDRAFMSCGNLISITLPVASTIGTGAFQWCTNLKYACLPLARSVPGYCFASCSNLSMVYLPKCSYIGSYAFSYCSKLEALFLTNTSEYVSLYNYALFSFTPIVKSSYLGYYGSIFVPSSMLASYKSRMSWSVHKNRLVGVGSLFLFYITDGLNEKVCAAEVGATWGQWINSPLNIRSLYSSTSTGDICLTDGTATIFDGMAFSNVSVNDLISSDTTYLTVLH